MKGRTGTPTQIEHLTGKQAKDLRVGNKIRAQIKTRRIKHRYCECLKDTSSPATPKLVKNQVLMSDKISCQDPLQTESLLTNPIQPHDPRP